MLAALLAARETGVGDYVMTSLYGTGNFVTAGFATNCNYGYEWPREAHTMSPLGQGYKCRDGRYIYVFVNDYTSVWPKFAKALRLPEEVVTDPRFTTKESTTIIANRSALVDIIREYALQRDAQDILDELVAYDVPSCILNQYKDRFSGEWLEQSVSNGYLIEHTYPSGNKAYLAQMPIYFDSLGVQDLYAQHRALGADNEAMRAGIPGCHKELAMNLDVCLGDIKGLPNQERDLLIGYLKERSKDLQRPPLSYYEQAISNLENREGVQFQDLIYEEALKKAGKEGKMVFMDCYTVWCGPCKMMNERVFTQKVVGDYFKKHFIPLKVDMEKGEGIALRKKFDVNAFPTMFILDAEGNIVGKLQGARDTDIFLKELKEILGDE